MNRGFVKSWRTWVAMLALSGALFFVSDALWTNPASMSGVAFADGEEEGWDWDWWGWWNENNGDNDGMIDINDE